jgi:hypothetical protein
MEYLPLSRNPIHEPIEIPFRGKLDAKLYDGDSFDTYSERQGRGSRMVAEWERIFSKPPKEFRAFLQRQLFFCPLYVLTGSWVRLSDFVRRVNGNPDRPVIITARLRPILER